jgi:drug/metabolite transporter (DMT)-like permease
MKKKVYPTSEKYWRCLTNIWLGVMVCVILIDFWSNGEYYFLISPVSILYITLLSVYITSKEFKRWFKDYKGHHPGEIALVIWTVLIFALIVSNAYLGSNYHICQEVISTYLVVVVLFIASRGSKMIYFKQKQKRVSPCKVKVKF